MPQMYKRTIPFNDPVIGVGAWIGHTYFCQTMHKLVMIRMPHGKIQKLFTRNDPGVLCACAKYCFYAVGLSVMIFDELGERLPFTLTGLTHRTLVGTGDNVLLAYDGTTIMQFAITSRTSYTMDHVSVGPGFDIVRIDSLHGCIHLRNRRYESCISTFAQLASCQPPVRCDIPPHNYLSPVSADKQYFAVLCGNRIIVGSRRLDRAVSVRTRIALA